MVIIDFLLYYSKFIYFLILNLLTINSIYHLFTSFILFKNNTKRISLLLALFIQSNTLHNDYQPYFHPKHQ
jgi:uncharacterized membrane protein